MLKKSKGLIIGIIIGVLIGSTVAVAAGNTSTLYNVITSGIRIVVDGHELHPTDVNGKTVNPIAYNGTTYLPVRAVSSALGKAVYWDGPTSTVYLGDMDGKLEYPTVMLQDMVSINHSARTTDRLKDNYGNRYGSAIYNRSANYKLEYLLAMRYSRFKGTLYIPEGETSEKTVFLTIKADGHIIYTSPEMTRASAPVDIDVNVSGYNDVSIEWSTYSSYLACCLADAGFYQ